MISKALLKLLLILTALIILPGFSQILANEVKPVLMIPADWKSRVPPAKEETYKRNIIKSLEEVQQYFASKLGGGSFSFNKNVTVIHSKYSTPQDSTKPDVIDMYDSLGGLQAIGKNLDTSSIYAIWVVGSHSLIPNASSDDSSAYWNISMENPSDIVDPSKIFKVAITNHEELDELGSASSKEKGEAIGTVGHELGHTFGLVAKGWSKTGHSCSSAVVGSTDYSKQDCKEGAPRPLPPPQETLDGLMNVGWDIFPRSLLNNSIHNPEITTLCQSSYFNTNKSNCPAPGSSVSTVKITEIPQKPIVAGQSEDVPILGQGFGSSQGKVELTSSDYADAVNNNFSIVSWSDTKIVLKINKEAAFKGNSTFWKFKVTTSDGQIAYSDQNLNIISDNTSNKKSTLHVPKVKVTCNSSPAQGALLRLFKSGYSQTLVQYRTDQSGEASITFTDLSSNPGQKYSLKLDPEGNSPASPQEVILEADKDYGEPVNFSFCKNNTTSIEVCTELELTEFRGCDETACGGEFWFCPKTNRNQSVNNPLGDCAIKGGPNPACKETGRSSTSNTENFFDKDGNRIPFFGIQLGNDDTGSLETIRQEAGIRLTELQGFGDSLNHLSSKVTDKNLKQLIELTNNQLNSGSKELNACVQ